MRPARPLRCARSAKRCWVSRLRAKLPPYATERFLAHPEPSLAWPVRNGERTPGKVAVFATCYVNFNEPGIGHDLLKLLAHNEIPYQVVAKEACCGMPKLELGDLAAVERLKDVNIPQLAALARDGYAIVTPVPSCTLMYKQELPLMFPDDAEVAARRGGDVRSLRVSGAARQGRAAQEGVHATAGHASAITSRVMRACRTSARRRAKFCNGCRGPT